MNKIHRIVWNEMTATWVAVAEVAKGHSKRSGTADRVDRIDRAALLTLPPLKALVAILMLIGSVAPMPTWAQVAANQLPTGGNVVAGAATITQGAAVLNINQTTNRAALDWNTFNVGSAAQVNFNQPSSSSVTLNRVLDSNPSQIFGRITAPGQVFLSNPNGVVFAPGARVDVGGLVATTHSISTADFMAGKTTFERNGSTGSVVNQGELKAALGGYIALLAPQVRNEGVIIAQAGTVALAAGEAITLNFAENGTLAGLTATQSQIAALVENKNAVLAPGGLIILSAQAVNSLQGGVIKNSGRIEATGISQRGGRIVLDASHTVENSGTISANASSGVDSGPAGTIEIIAAHASNTGAMEVKGTETEAAGSIHIRAGNFTQTAGALLNASAALRGGSITLAASGQLQLSGRVDVSATADSTVGGTGEPTVASTGGQITAEAAQIDLTNATLDASGGQGGRITLDASGAQPVAPATPAPQPPQPVPERGKLVLSGTTQLSTRGRRSNGGVGGDQTLLGDHIDLNDTAALDATGATGGGTVRVGGGWQGSGGYYQATTVTMAEGASIDVSATKVGDGGTLVLWSKAYTGFYGQIAAKGGTEGGNGGQVETSSIDNLQAIGNVDASASAGRSGNWLLDPRNVTITTSTAGGTYSGGIFTPTSDSATINVSSIVASLNAGTSVTITTGTTGTQAGDITVSSGISTGTATGTRTLTLNAAGAIVVNANIGSTTGTLNVALNAGGTISGSGGITTTNAGNLNISAGGNVTLTGAVVVAGATSITAGVNNIELKNASNNFTGAVSVVSGGYLNLSDTNALVLGNSTLSQSADVYSGGALTQSGALSIASWSRFQAGSNDITLDNSGNNFGGDVGVYGNNVSLRDTNALGLWTSSVSGTLTVQSGGVLTMASAYTVTTTNTTTGNIIFNTTGLAGSGNITLANGRTLTVTQSADSSYSGVISGTGSAFTKAGAGTLTLSGANTYTGATTISGGTLSVSSLDNSGSNSNIGASSNSASNLVLSGGGTLKYTGSGANTDRLFSLGSGGGTIDASGTGPLTFYNYAPITGATFGLTLGGTHTDSSLLSTIGTGSGAVTKSGTGTWTLRASTYTGATTINAGTLAYGANDVISSGPINVSGGTLNMGSYSDSVGAVTLTSGSITGTTGTLTGSSYIVKSGTISAKLGGATALTKDTTGTVTLSGANTYTGATTISGGTLSVSSLAHGGSNSNIGASINSASNLVLSGGGTLKYTGSGASTDRLFSLGSGGGTIDASGTGSLTFVNFGTITGNTFGLTLGGTHTGSSLASTIGTGSGAVTKSGTGTWTLSRASTYTGATTISAGTLAVTANNALGTNAAGTTVASGATLDFQGVTYSTAEGLTINGGTLKASTGTSSFAGGITLGAASTVNVSGTQFTHSGALNAAGFQTTFTGAGSAIFTTATNDFGTVLLTNAGSVSVVDTNTLTLGASTFSGNLTADARAGGIVVTNNSIASTSGNITLIGVGNASHNSGRGITLTDAALTSGGGNITLTGTGAANSGVELKSTVAAATSSAGTRLITSGSGTVNITGSVTAAGNTTSANQYGIVFYRASSSTSGAFLQTQNGNITLTGTGGNFSPTLSTDETAVAGVDVRLSTIQSTGNGSITIVGTGPTGSAGSGGDRDGVNIENNSILRTGWNGTTAGGTGAVSITGTAYGRGEGVDLENSTTVQIIAGSGGVTITGSNANGTSDGMQIAGIINSLGGTITLTGNGGTGSDLSPGGGEGIWVGNGLTLGSTSTSGITLIGAARSDNDVGVLFDSSGTTTLRTSATGWIKITGTGFGTKLGVQSDRNSNLFSAGSGAVPGVAGRTGLWISGTGGATGSGVELKGTFGATGGDVSIAGTTGSSASGKIGLQLRDSSTFRTLTSGSVYLTGTSANSLASNHGVSLSTVGVAAAGSGSITVDGTASGSFDSVRVSSANTATLTTAGGNISLTGRGSSSAINQYASSVLNTNATAGGTVSLAAVTGTINLGNSGNDFIGAVVVSAAGNVTLTDANTLKLGNNISGVTAAGTVSISTLNGDLTVANNITTTDATSSAITINAGKTAAASTSSGGNILISGGGVTTGAGGRATLYSGSVAGSTGLTALVGSGSGRFRYNSDETATNYTTALGSGLYAIYREAPVLSVSWATNSVVYGTALPTLGSLSGLQNGDTGTVTFDVSGSTSSAGFYTVGTHTITPTVSNGLGYGLGTTTGSLTVTKSALTLTSTGVNKTYDGTTAGTVTLGALGGTVGIDNVSIASNSATFDSANAGVGRTLSVAYTLTGTDAGNYSLANGSTTADILQKTLTISGSSVANKTYDGTTNATLSLGTLTGLVDRQTLGVSGLGAFADATAATGKNVTVSHTLANGSNGGLASNYSLANQTLTADINKAALTIAANNDARFVTEADTSGFAGVRYTGFVNGETAANLGTAPTISRTNSGTNVAAGSYAGTLVPGGAASTNYAFTYANGDYTIVGAEKLLVRVAEQSATYGTAPGFTVTSAKYLASDLTTIVDLTANVLAGGNNITLTDGAGGAASFTLGALSPLTSTSGNLRVGSYEVGATNVTETSANFNNSLAVVGSVAVTQKSLTPTAANVTKVYDGDTSMAGLTLGLPGKVEADVLTVSGTSAYASKNAGTGLNYTVSGMALAGADAANYALGATSLAGTNGVITPKTLTVGYTGDNKTYDATTTATVTTSDDRISGDVLNISRTAAFGDKNVGTGKTVNVSSVSLSGADASNYSLTSSSGSTIANITVAELTLAGFNSVIKNYDGTTTLPTSTLGYGNLVGLAGADSVTVAGAAVFDSANAGSRTVQVGSVALAGADAGNYTLNWTNGSGTINQAALTVSANSDAQFVTLADTSGYNGVSYSGFVNGETSATAGLTGTVAIARSGGDTAAGIYSGVLTASGLSASNYAITYAAGDYSIVAAQQLLVKVANVSTTYGAGPGYTVSSAQYLNGSSVLTNLTQTSVSGNTYTYSDAAGGSATFTLGASGAVNSTSGNLVVGNYGITGNSTSIVGSNFTDLNFTGSQTVTTKTLTGTATGVNKVYDGSKAFAGATIGASGIVGSDAVSVSGTGLYGSKNAGSGLAYTVSGLSLSGADADNYVFGASSYAGADGAITPKALTVSFSGVNRVYDGTTNASFTSGDNRVAGDSLTVTGSAAFADKNVANGKTVNLTSVGITGTDAANYTVATTGSTTANITPRTLSVSYTGQSKVYDSTTTTTVTTSDNRVSGDVLSVTRTAAFDDKNVGTGKTVNVTGVSLGSTDAGNYVLAATSGTASADVTAKALTVTYTGVNKTYDATTATTVTTSDDRISGDALTINRASAFSDKNAATGKTVSVSGATLAGADAGNYTVAATGNTAANITQASATLVGATAVDKTYDGTANLPSGNTGYGTLGGTIGSDTLSLIGTAVYSSKDAGARTVNVGSVALAGADAGNYTLGWTNGSGTIAQAALTVRADNDGRFFSQTETAAAAANYAGVTYTGFVGGENAGTAGLTGTLAVVRTGLTGDGSTDSAGTYALTPSGLSSGNYAITHQAGSYTIVPADRLLIKVTDATTTYGTAATYAVSSAEYMIGTTVTTLANPAPGNSVTVDGVTISLAPVSATNSTGGFLRVGSYELGGSITSGTSANFTQLVVVGSHQVNSKALTAAATGVSKTYDGNTSMSGVTIGLTGKKAADMVTVSGSGAFGSKNASATANLSYTISGLALASTDAANYYLTGGTSFSGTDGQINAKTLNVTYAGVNKVYDGNISTSVTTGDDRVAGDTLTINRTAAFDNTGGTGKNVGTGKTVNVTGASLAATGDYANYTLAATTGSTTANITAAALSISGTTASAKTYDRLTSAAVSTAGVTKTGLIGSDNVTVAAAGTFADKNVGSGKTVTLSSTYGGADAGNYTITNQATTTANITVANLSITGVTASNKVYDGTTTATLGGAATVMALGSDVVTVSGTGNGVFADKDVGTGKAVTVSGFTLSGTDAGNYTVVQPAGVTANITAAPLAVTANSATKTYDGAAFTGGNGVTYSGFVNSETISVLGGTVGYSGTSQGAINVGNYVITPGGLTSSNYNLSFVNGALSISAAPITAITGNLTGTVSKTYDGTNVATLVPSNYLLAGWVSSDNASVTKTSGTFDNANAGTAKTVTVSLTNSDYAATGSTNLSNYGLPTSVSGAVGTINKANATVTANSNTVTYSGLAQSVTGFTASGLVNGELATVLTGVTTTGGSGTNAGSYTHTASGTDENYELGFVAGALTIVAAPPPPVEPPVEPPPPPPPVEPPVEPPPPPPPVEPPVEPPPPDPDPTPDAPLVIPTVIDTSPLPPGSGSGDSGFGTGGGGRTGSPNPLLNVNPALVIPLSGSGEGSGDGGAASGQMGAGGISISLNTAPSGNADGGVQISVVTVSVPKAMATAGTGFSFEVPAQVRESLGTGVFQVMQADGSPLPTWIRFDLSTQRFEAGAVPDGGLPLQVMIRSGATQVLIVISERAE